MGRFSTSAQYFLEPTGKLDDDSGRFEIGHTRASKRFLQELQETYIYPVWELIKAGRDPILQMLASADCTDEQLFKNYGHVSGPTRIASLAPSAGQRK